MKDGAGAKPTKSFASLCPALLARKGGARPAMRPAGRFGDSLARAFDRDAEHDLGWNDFGEQDLPENADTESGHVAAGVVVPIGHDAADAVDAVVPAVIRQRMAAEQRIAADTAAARGRRSAGEAGRKAAFTLRLDPERHLKLRLACTVDARSAQQVVTEALDRLLAEMPDIAALADHVGKQRKT